MTYTTGDAWRRKPTLTAVPRRDSTRADEQNLKESHLNRLRQPQSTVASRHETPAAVDKRRYDISVQLDDGRVIAQEHFAPADFYLEDICANFSRGTLIAAQNGQTAIEDLRPGDKIKTRDNGVMSVRWIGSCDFGGPQTASEQSGFPIRIKAGALGEMRPEQDLLVSSRFRLLSNHPSCTALFGSSETLAAAKDLLDEDTVLQVRPPQDITFFNLMLDSHQIIQANGLDTESYHPGNFGISVMTLEMQHHLRQIFPHLDGNLSRFGRTVRPILKGFEAEVLRVG